VERFLLNAWDERIHMALRDDLESDVSTIFRSAWSTTEKVTIPVATDLALGNNAGHFSKMTVLYADLNGSTSMVDNETWSFSAEVYKAYLHCAAKIIKNEGGTITAYDGDRVMAVFIGDVKNTSAVRCALKINSAVIDIVNPKLKITYPLKNFVVRHSIGIDTSEIHVARIGVKNDNDLVWVGRAANHAAKLTAIPDLNYPIWINADVYNSMNDEVKVSSGTNMWVARSWTQMNNAKIYCSSYKWNV
jgi:class 3 adenylate cyclase